MKWNIDAAHTTVEFAVKHLMISTVKGRFKKFEGTGETDDAGALESVTLTIDAASVDTGVEQRDDHLRSPDFFDVARYPQIAFRSTKVEETAEGVTISGDLTMHGVTKPIKLKGEYQTAMTDPWGNQRSALSASAKINRKEWGLTYNIALETGGWIVGEDVKIEVEVEAVAVPEHQPVAA